MIPNPTMPYPGLRPFEDDEDHLFFGREEQSDALVERLTGNRFLAVIGSSGSGKSSLVRAGLLPTLYGGLVPGVSSAWRVAVFRPAANPMRQLALGLLGGTAYGSSEPAGARPLTRSTSGIRSLADLAGDATERAAMIEATLHRSSRGLVEAVRQLGRDRPDNLLVVVDQFEELFRYGGPGNNPNYADEGAGFVKLLLTAASQDDLPIYVIITMRSDFLGDCARFRDLPEMLNRGQYLVPRLTRDQLRAVIEGPARVAGASVSHRLMQRLLNDVGDNQDQLPILQHALMRTWRAWEDDHAEGEPIDLRHFEAIGGMARALSLHADEAFDDLSDGAQRRLAERVFQALTEQELDNRSIRTPQTVSDLTAITDTPQQTVLGVLEVFRRPDRSFLMPPAEVEAQGHTMIDISHEALIRRWGRLRRWVREEAEGAQVYRRLADAARLHERGEASLWRGTELRIATRWREQWEPNAAWAHQYAPGFERAMAFLAASHDAEAEESRKERMAEERSRQLRVSRIVGTSFVVLLALAGVLGGGALWAMHHLRQSLGEKIELNLAIQETTEAVLDMQAAQNQFQLNWRSMGATRAQADYAVKAHQHLAQLQAALADLHHQAEAHRPEIEALSAELEEYERDFEKHVRLAVKRGFKNEGKVGTFRRAAHAIEEALKGDAELQVDVLLLRRNEKDFLLREDEKYVKAVIEQLGKLRDHAAKQGLSEKVGKLVASYESAFKEMVAVEQEIEKGEEELQRNIERIGDLARDVSNGAARRAREAGDDAHATARVVMIIGIIVLLAGAVLAWVVLHYLPNSMREASQGANER